LIIRSTFEVHTACIVNEAQDGADAVAKAKTFNPDLVVMDLPILGMHGLEATPKIEKGAWSGAIHPFHRARKYPDSVGR
jgi:CheY-like chemotaxis protein